MKKLIVGMMLVMTPFAYADGNKEGGREGHGGVSVVCRDARGKITSAKLLDIFEGEKNPDMALHFDESVSDVDLRIELAQIRMAQDANFMALFQDELAKVRANIRIIPDPNVGLEPTNDAFPVLHDKRCKFEQVAVYQQDGIVLVDSEIFAKFSPLNQAALFVHEAVYAVARNRSGDSTSVKSRKLTAYLLAKEDKHAQINSLMKSLGTKKANKSERVDDRDIFDVIGDRLCSVKMVKQDKSTLILITVNGRVKCKNSFGMEFTRQANDKRSFYSPKERCSLHIINDDSFSLKCDRLRGVYTYERHR